MYSMDLSLIVDLPQNQRLSSQSRSLSRRRLNRPRRYRVHQPQRRNLKEVGSNRTLIISFRHSTREKNVSLKLSRIGFFITCSAAKWRLGSCIHVISFFFLVFVSYAEWMSQIYIFQFLAYLFLYKHCQNISLNIPVHVYMFRTLFSIKAWLSFPFCSWCELFSQYCQHDIAFLWCISEWILAVHFNTGASEEGSHTLPKPKRRGD